jgi:hypothetical protein
MKYSYRSVGRQSESAIYMAIRNGFPDGIDGLCEFLYGHDSAWDVTGQKVELSQLNDRAIDSLRKHQQSNLTPVSC